MMQVLLWWQESEKPPACICSCSTLHTPTSWSWLSQLSLCFKMRILCDHMRPGGPGEVFCGQKDHQLVEHRVHLWVLEFLFGFFNKRFFLGKQEVVLVSCCLAPIPWVQLHRCSLHDDFHLWHHLRDFGAVSPIG